MTHNEQAKELLKDSRLAKNIQVCKDVHTGHYNATCYIPELGEVSQWGTTEQSAWANLRDYVTMVLKCDWPPDEEGG